MQILGLLLVLLLEAQDGRSSRNGERVQGAIISEADGTFSKNGTIYEGGLIAAPKKADSQDAEHARNNNCNKSWVKQQKVMKLELQSGKVTVVMMDLSIHEPRESVIVWEGGVEKWDQSKSETAADYENGVSRQALDYAWEKSKPSAHSFIVATDKVPVKQEVQDMFNEDHFVSSVNIVFTETGNAVSLFNKELAQNMPATVMLSLDGHTDSEEPHGLDQSKKSFGRATAYPESALVAFATFMSFIFARYR